MIIHEVKQGSPEWLELRAGIPTASSFDDILTPTGKPCTGERTERYMFTLLAERIMGCPTIEHVSTWMDRGSQMEAEAVNFYEFQTDVETVKVGFVTNDTGTVGASPDRFVGDDGLLEIKVPKESTHVGYLIKKAVDQKYYPQAQGQLWVTGRRFADILSYHPLMPTALVRVERDEKYIESLAAAVTAFSQQLESLYAQLCESGLVKAPKKHEPSLVDILKASMAEMNK